MTNATTRPAGTRRRILVWAAAVGLMALALWYFWPGTAGGPGGSGGRGFRMSGQATPVSVARAEPGRIDRTLRALGTVTPLATVTIRARVDGPLQSVNFDDGQAVRAGDVLAVIDPKPFRVQLDQALGQQMQHAAQLDQARRDLARYEQLFKQDSVARQQLDSARALVRELQGQAKSDQAAVDDARLQLGYTEIRAPVDGRLGLRKVDAGNLIRASDTDGLVVLTQSRPIDVVFSIPQTRLQALLEARRAEPGLQTRLFSDAAGTALATGTLVAVDNQIDVATGTVQLKARFDNADESLFPNQFVQVRLRLGTQDGVTLPLRAVQRGSQGEYVYRLDAEGKARVVPVTTGVDDGERVVIESGLQAGDTVAVEGTDRLRDGSEVEIVSPEAAGAGAGGPAAPDTGAPPDGTRAGDGAGKAPAGAAETAGARRGAGRSPAS
ncbi:efflux RND transporter periplasmic adaptor subunit [Castellaniella sp.]|uniref:efflux RND transporter periplasmic adaptor subunit n=1 Tax=Castellaniella sp. TaxID=1955812 RepID=UPI002AFE856B|nr:efflux RND transporter periplasmic adaptor subunit [Castellaniella sp.]